MIEAERKCVMSCTLYEIFVDYLVSRARTRRKKRKKIMKKQGLVNRLGKISDCANDELSPAILYYILLCTAGRLAVFVTWRKEEENKLSHP